MSDSRVVEVYEVVRLVVRSLVDHPDDVKVIIFPQESGFLFRVNVHPSDVGKVVGASGRMSRNIRSILNANAAKDKRSYFLDVVDPLQGRYGPALTRFPPVGVRQFTFSKV